MDGLRFLADRTAVLFLGVAAGAAIGFAFAGSRAPTDVPVTIAAPESAPVQGAPASEAPPPPTAPAAPSDETEETKPTPEKAAEPVKSAVVTPEAPMADAATPTIAAATASGRPIRIGVFGDSFGDGVWSALYRLLPAKDGYQVTKYSQQSTGFTRYRSLNLEDHDDGQIGATPIDVAVVSFGANDMQGVCDGGHCGALMSAYWQQVIAGRMERYVQMLRRHGATVYWIGLPAMRDATYDSNTIAMDAFYGATMRRLGVPFIEIRPMTVGPDGRYEAYYEDADGNSKLLRAGDGIHMSMNGYIRITKALAGRIRATVEAARRQSAPPAAEDESGAGAS